MDVGKDIDGTFIVSSSIYSCPFKQCVRKIQYDGLLPLTACHYLTMSTLMWVQQEYFYQKPAPLISFLCRKLDVQYIGE